MKNKQALILIGISIVVTFGLTRMWDLYHINLPLKQDIKLVNNEKHDNQIDYNDSIAEVILSTEELEEFEITVDTAGPRILTVYRVLPGEIAIDPNRLAHIVPRFPGIVRDVRKGLGDRVEQGEVLAIIESNESLSPYEVRSLISGTIIEMHLTQ